MTFWNSRRRFESDTSGLTQKPSRSNAAIYSPQILLSVCRSYPRPRDEAAQTLKDLERVESLSGELRSYHGASPYFIVWGLAWMLGYAGSDIAPEYRTLVWGAAIGLGAVSSIVLGQRHAGGGSSSLWRSLAIAGGMAAFIGAIFVVIGPMQQSRADAIIPLVFAAVYALAGLRFGRRFAICGVVLGVLTVFGFVAAGNHFGLWMAAIGGGCLLLTGFLVAESLTWTSRTKLSTSRCG